MVKVALPIYSKHQLILFKITVGLIIIVAACLRLFQLDQPRQYIFDEDFFAFTATMMAQGQIVAYEFWHQPFVELKSNYLYRPPAIEWLHPPVAKLFMAAGIKVMGNHPMGWRITPAISGILLVIVTMWLSHQLFPQHRLVTLMTGFLVAVNHWLVIESKLAGANMILTLFSTLMILLTWQIGQKLQTKSTTSTRWLHFVIWAVVAGLAIATKWSAGFIWLGCWVWLCGQLHQSSIKNKFRWLTTRIIVFLLVAGTVYVLSYGQYFYLTKLNFSGWSQLQSAMISYQVTTPEQHAFASRPWQWPVNQVTIPYFLPTHSQFKQADIWAGTWLLPLGGLALLWTIIRRLLIKKQNRENPSHSFLICLVICFWLPWFLVSRTLFIYHALPVLPLLLILFSRRLMDLYQFGADTVKRTKS